MAGADGSVECFYLDRTAKLEEKIKKFDKFRMAIKDAMSEFYDYEIIAAVREALTELEE